MLKKKEQLKKSVILTVVSTMIVGALSGCNIVKEQETESLSPEELYEIEYKTSTNNCLELANGQFYVWHDSKTHNIEDDLFTSAEDIDERFKDYQSKVFRPVIIENNTMDGTYGDLCFGKDDRIAWFTDEELKKIPHLKAGDKLIYSSVNDIQFPFSFEHFDDLGYSIGAYGFNVDDSNHTYISLEQGRFSTSSSFYNIYTKMTDLLYNIGEGQKVADKLVIDKINGTPLTESNVDPIYHIITGLEPNGKYKFDVYYGSVSLASIVGEDSTAIADSVVLGSSGVNQLSNNQLIESIKDEENESDVDKNDAENDEEDDENDVNKGQHMSFSEESLIPNDSGSFISVKYTLYNSTIAVIELPEEGMKEGYYLINNKGFFYYETDEKETE